MENSKNTKAHQCLTCFAKYKRDFAVKYVNRPKPHSKRIHYGRVTVVGSITMKLILKRAQSSALKKAIFLNFLYSP